MASDIKKNAELLRSATWEMSNKVLKGTVDADSELDKAIQSTLNSLASPEAEVHNIMEDWSPSRKKVGRAILSVPFELFVVAIVFANTFFLILEVDANAGCGGKSISEQSKCKLSYAEVMSHVFLAIYTVELILQVYVSREGFFKSVWGWLDLGIVAVGYLEVLITIIAGAEGDYNKALGYLRIVRLTRLFRVVHICRPVPELYRMLAGFASTLKAIFWGTILLFAMLLVWSIITVEVVNHYELAKEVFNGTSDDDKYCTDAFTSVLKTNLFYYQTLIAGDGWSTCVIPLTKHSPGIFWLFGAAQISVQLGFTNLILAVIVEAAAEAREADHEEKARALKATEIEGVRDFVTMCKKMDRDQNGYVSVPEFVAGYDADPNIKNRFTTMGLDKNDLVDFMLLMDADHSEHLSYEEFTRAMLKTGNQDPRLQMTFLKAAVDSLIAQFDERLNQQESLIGMLLSAQGLSLDGCNLQRRACRNSRTRGKHVLQKGEPESSRVVQEPSPNRLEADDVDLFAESLDSEVACEVQRVPEIVTGQKPSFQGLRAANVKDVAFEHLEEELQSVRLNLEKSLQALLSEAAERAAALSIDVARGVVETMQNSTYQPKTSELAPVVPSERCSSSNRLVGAVISTEAKAQHDPQVSPAS